MLLFSAGVLSFEATTMYLNCSCSFSMMESKRVEFQFEVEGMQDLELEEEKSLNATVQEFKEQSKMVKKKVMAVRSRVARMKHQQWRMKSNMDKDINRAEAITGE